MQQFRIYISLLLAILTFPIFAQNSDSLSYEVQRAQVNKLIEDRKLKFSAYDVSLEQKTGIFGLFKSKDDMQKSIDILKEIVITDNHIFLETRKLIDIKDDERIKFQNLASEYDKQVSAYMNSINKLQKENETLRKDLLTIEDGGQTNNVFLFIALFIILILTYFLFRKQKITKV